MDSQIQVSQLEQALLHQAETLVREHQHSAELARIRIHDETEQRLKLLGEREVMAAKAEAERRVRQRLQAAETRLAGDLDRLRWALTQSIFAQVRAGLAALSRDPARYHPLLADLLAAAAEVLPPGDLVAEVAGADRESLQSGWAEMTARAAPGRKVTLASLDRPSLGGLRVRLADGRAQLDQTFEARQERLADELAQLVMERLFATAPDLGSLMYG